MHLYRRHQPAAVDRRSTALSLLLLLIGLLVWLAGCTVPATPTPVPEPISLQLNWQHSPQFIGYYVAEEKGFYAEENLAVELRPLAPDSELTPEEMLAQGHADLTVLGLNVIPRLAEEGVPATALAALYQISPRVFLALEESGIRHPRDLVGRRVGIKSPGWRASIHQVLEQIGIDPAAIIEVDVAADSMEEMFYTGEVDVWTGFVTDEVVTARRDGHPIDVIFPADYAVGTYIGLITALQSTIDEKSDVVERFVRASLRGWEYAIENPDEAAAIGFQWDPEHDLATHRDAIHELTPLIDTGQVPIGWIDADRWRREMGDAYDPEQPGFTLSAVLGIPDIQSWFAAGSEGE